MNILVVTTKSPWPLNEGRALRTYNLLRQASKRNRITLCTYVQSQAEIDGLDEMRKFCDVVHAVPLYMSWPKLALLADAIRDLFGSVPLHARKYARKRMVQLVGSLLDSRNYDALHLDMLHLAELSKIDTGIPVLLVEHNIESQILQRRLDNEKNTLVKAYLKYQIAKLRQYEVDVCNAVDHVVTVSDEDRKQLQVLGVSSPVTAVPNAVDVEFFQPGQEQPRADTLIYVGSLGWFPNEDAIRYFMSEILPFLEQMVPTVSMKVIGHVPDAAKKGRWKDDRRVEFLGFVDDIRPHVLAASIYVVPLRIGGGTRLKILDAMAMGKALVTTSVGCEGIGLVDGQQALIADGPEAFAAAVASLLAHPARISKMGACGREYVCNNFRWEQIAPGMDEVYESIAAVSAGRETT